MTQRSEIIFVTLIVPLILGICLFYQNGSRFALNALLIICGILLMFLLALRLFYRGKNLFYTGSGPFRTGHSIHGIKLAVQCTFYLLTFFYGGLICILAQENLKQDHFAAAESDFLKVRIDDEPQVKNNIIRFKSKVIQSIKNYIPKHTSGHLLISIQLDSVPSSRFSYGDELMVPSAFKEVPEPRNPSQFNTRSWLAQQNIYHQLFLTTTQVEHGKKNTGNPIIAYAIQVRQTKVEVLRKLICSQEAFAVASTLILGYRSDLSPETLQAYSKTGTIHALSVSGMHVGIIYIVVNLALSRLDRRTYGRLTKVILILSMIWFYALITGLTPSVLRSVIMLSAFVLAKSLRKTTNSYNVLAFSAFCMLTFSPFLLFDLGFQLSYISVIGLIFLQPKINSWFAVENKVLKSLWSALSLSLAAQLITFPLSVYYFHQFPVYFLVSNVFLVIPISIMMYLGLIILIFRLYFLGPIFEWVINATNRSLKFIAELPFSTVSEIWIGKGELILLFSCIILLCYSLIYYRKGMLSAALGLMLAFAASLTVQTAHHYRQRKLIFFSLPKNYAVAFIEGNKAVILTDLQRTASAYKFNIQPFLDQSQIQTVTLLLPHQIYRGRQLIISAHQIQFYTHSIFFTDSCFNAKTPANEQHFNTILLNGSPRTSLSQLLRKTAPDRLIIDGSNKAYAAQQYENDGKKFNIPVQNLKKLKAYLINLK